MNQELSRLAAQINLDEPPCESLRLAFGLACVQRAEHLLEDPEAIRCLAVFKSFVEGKADRAALAQAAQKVAAVAGSHRGSNSIDGSAHAAVSATYALANALAGRALEAAGYAAYACVYGYGGYAVADPSAFEPEHSWQVQQLKALLALHPAPCSA
ncbi:MAG: hypothetical protein ABIP46_01220 [Polaromonas sp.]